jgi:hypothetical protein
MWSCPKELLNEPDDWWSERITSSSPLMEVIYKGTGLLSDTNKG